MPGPDERRGRDDGVQWSFGGEGGGRLGDGAPVAPTAVGAGGGPLPARPGDAGYGAAPLADATDGGNLDAAGPGAGRRWTARLAGGLLAAAAVGAALWSLRNERLHRRIQRDVQAVVALEAQAQRDGDREIYLGLQDESRRRQLRRPDQIAADAYAAGPFPGLTFQGDAPRVTAVEVAEAAAGGHVRAITATVRADATDGVRVGVFEQRRRMVFADDGRWLHASLPPDGGGADEVDFGSPWISATFPAADEAVLRPALTAAADAVESLCADTGRCDGRLWLTMGARGRGDRQLTAPSRSWQPADATARALLAFSIARTAAIALDGPGPEVRYDRDRFALATAGLDVHLLRRLDPAAAAALADDATAAQRDLTLWHIGPFGLGPAGAPAAVRLAVARSFVARAAADDPRRLPDLLAAWRLSDPAALQLTAPSLRSALGPDGLALALNWPRPQAPSPINAPFVALCEGFDPLIVDAAQVTAISEHVCGDAFAGALQWHPTQPALAVACARVGGDGVQPPDVQQIAVLRRGALGRWAAERRALPHAPDDITWSADGRWLLWSAYGADVDGRRTVPELWRSSWTVEAGVGRLGSAERIDGPLAGAASPAAAPARSTFASELGVASPDRRWVARVVTPARPADGDGDDAGDRMDAGRGTWAIDVLDATTGAAVRRLALDEATLRPARRNAGHLALESNLAPAGLAWSDDSRWLATTLPTAWRCANRRDCQLVVAWQPASDERHAFFNAPLEDDVDAQWLWRLGWLPGSTRLALHIEGDGDGRPSGVAGEPERPSRWLSTGRAPDAAVGGGPPPDPAVGYLLDVTTGAVERVPRSASDRLAPLLPNVSPDGRWRLRRDALDYLVAEPSVAAGGADADDEAGGWRLNRPFCSPFVLWGPPDA